MGIPDRLFNLAKSYLDSAKSRWDEVDAAAQEELNSALTTPTPSAWDRAQAKIDQARGAVKASAELGPPTAAAIPMPAAADPGPRPSENALAAAYRVLDVPANSDLLAVQKAYHDLLEKADPNHFPEGSNERKLAADIARKLNGAYMVLANALSTTSEDRFDRLEL